MSASSSVCVLVNGYIKNHFSIKTKKDILLISNDVQKLIISFYGNYITMQNFQYKNKNRILPKKRNKNKEMTEWKIVCIKLYIKST